MNRRPPRAQLSGELDVLVRLAGVIVALGALCWWSGQVAGLLSHGHWPAVRPGQALPIGTRIALHPANPALAWPPAARPGLGPTWLFWVCLLLSVVALAAALDAAHRAVRRRRRTSPDGFAAPRQIAAALSPAAILARAGVIRPSLAGKRVRVEDLGVRLGRSHPDGQPVAISAEESVIVLSAPRQGKTSQIVVPWVRSWPGPALVSSIRPDVLLATATLRRDCGPVAVFAPTGMLTWPDQVRWSPTSGCEDVARALARAELMVSVGKDSTRDDSKNAGYFGLNAQTLLAGWLHAAAVAGRSMRDVAAWATRPSDNTPIDILATHPGADQEWGKLLGELYDTAPETKQGLFTTAATAVVPLRTPAAADAFCPAAGASFDLHRFLREGGTVYLLVAKERASRLAPLVSAFVDELVETAKRLADRAPGGRLDPPLGLFLDEVANISPLPSLPDLLSFAGGSGVFATAVLQSFAQAESQWGRHGARMLWGAGTVKVILGGLSGEELRRVSELTGEHERTLISRTQGGDGSISRQVSTRHEPTMRPGQIRTLDAAARECLVIHATTPAFRARMVRFFEGPHRASYAAAVAEASRIAGIGLGTSP